MAETLAGVPAEPPAGQDVIRPWTKPLYAQGHLAILRGNLATEGAVAKVTGVKDPVHDRPRARLRQRGGLHQGDLRPARSGPATW